MRQKDHISVKFTEDGNRALGIKEMVPTLRECSVSYVVLEGHDLCSLPSTGSE